MRVSTPSTSSQCKGLLSRAALVSLVCAMIAMQNQGLASQSAEMRSIPSVAAQYYDSIDESADNEADIDSADTQDSLDAQESYDAEAGAEAAASAQEIWLKGLVDGTAKFFGSATDTTAYLGKTGWHGMEKLGTVTVDAGQGLVGTAIGAKTVIKKEHAETKQDLAKSEIAGAQVDKRTAQQQALAAQQLAAVNGQRRMDVDEEEVDQVDQEQAQQDDAALFQEDDAQSPTEDDDANAPLTDAELHHSNPTGVELRVTVPEHLMAQTQDVIPVPAHLPMGQDFIDQAGRRFKKVRATIAKRVARGWEQFERAGDHFVAREMQFAHEQDDNQQSSPSQTVPATVSSLDASSSVSSDSQATPVDEQAAANDDGDDSGASTDSAESWTSLRDRLRAVLRRKSKNHGQEQSHGGEGELTHANHEEQHGSRE